MITWSSSTPRRVGSPKRWLGRLARAGHRSAPYHAGLTKDRRAETLQAFLDDRVDVIVATCAFGMGIDKPDVRQVVHWTLPATPEAYYQEAGRAGRDGAFARCVLLWRPRDAELHRRQLDVTFPPRQLLERLWTEGESISGIPTNVRESSERLKRELRPDRGPVAWGQVHARRQNAERRIAAIENYARGNSCRRGELLAYFGERLRRCAGCDRCRREAGHGPTNPAVHARWARLRRELGHREGPWGGALLEPEVLRRLAEQPPESAAALADVSGVGPALAERFGGAILRALGVPTVARDHAGSLTPIRASLERWRARVAAAMGVPDFRVLSDSALDALAAGSVHDRPSLARLPGIGPRTLAKFGDELLGLVRDSPARGPE